MDKIEEVVLNVLRARGFNVTNTSTSFDSLGIDSMDLFELVLYLEDEFNIVIDISTSTVQSMHTVQDLADLIRSLT